MRKMFFCLLAAGVLGAAAPALGNESDRSAPRAGIDVGPFGQCFDRMHPWECRDVADIPAALSVLSVPVLPASSLSLVRPIRMLRALCARNVLQVSTRSEADRSRSKQSEN